MRYFFDIHAQANKENEVSFFMVSPDSEADKIPQLTVDEVKKNPIYSEFSKTKFPLVMVTYKIFKTESDLPENVDFKSLIENKTAEFVANGELQITAKVKAKKSAARISKKKLYAIIGGVTALSMMLGIGIGSSIRNGGSRSSTNPLDGVATDSDGLIMPDAIEFSEGANLLTVSIDRSWSPVPREDLQVQGEIINGVAAVTLPAFDRTDFFNHVPGHTWGFTSDPNARRIEFYGGGTYNFTENVKLYRVLVRFGGGNGTQDDPYLINWFDQLQLMSQEQVRGYFRQTEDITFPCSASHIPINTVNELRRDPDSERFEYDGGGYLISGLNAPLFGTVSGSVIRNVNITNALIDTTRHANFGFIVREAFNYRYEVDGTTYETGETLIQNSTVSHSMMNLVYPAVDAHGQPLPETVPPVTQPVVVPPDLNTGDETETAPPPLPKRGEHSIGGITGVGGQIENCYVVNVVIVAELTDYFLYVGGISGKPANVINSGVVGFAVKGNVFHAGGIVGSAGGTRLYSATGAELPIFYGGNIQGNFVSNFVAYTENSAGGIAGEGSTNAENALISNNYATLLDFRVGVFARDDHERVNPLTIGISGGIIGMDGSENNGHLVVNTVSDAFYPVIGRSNRSRFDETVRLAPLDAYTQRSILDVLNRNTVHPNAPSVIFTGKFMFAEDERNGGYAFPSGIVELFGRTVIENEQ